jgi:two-component system, cell cycle sensor histidine kinase and response regulator CckA
MNAQNSFRAAATLEGAILVIDDELAIRDVLTDIFGFLTKATVYTAANGHDGLRILQQWQSIGLVFLDMNMPLMTGEETYERLRQIAPEVKVIVSSSLSQAEAKLRFGEQELPTFLQKPYDINALLDVVQSVSAMS